MRYILIFVIAIFSFAANGQPAQSTKFNLNDEEIRPLKKGDIIPNVLFVSKENFPKEINSIHDYKGKIVLLDFWSTGCSSCIEAFPKMERLQKQFGDRLQIVLVNSWETEELIKERMANRKHIKFAYPNLPRINGDSIWKALFPTRSVPHHVWLNEAGEIIAVTGGYNANEKTIAALLKGEVVHMLLKPSLDRMDLTKKSFIAAITNNAVQAEMGTNLYAYYEGEGAGVYGYDVLNVIDSQANTIRSSFINLTPMGIIKRLFKYVGRAVHEKDYLQDDLIYIESLDSTVFQERVPYEIYDEWSKRVKLCMEVVLPLEQKDAINQYAYEQLQQYIQHKFNIHISIEEKLKPCLILVQKSDKSLLQTKGGESKIIFPKQEEVQIKSYLNTEFESVFSAIEREIKAGIKEKVTILNEVPYEGNVDIVLPYVYADPNAISIMKEGLNKYGLDLVAGERKVKVFVVRDN